MKNEKNTHQYEKFFLPLSAPVIPFLKNNQKLTFFSFRIIEKIADGSNDVSHIHAKYQYKILCISSCTKMTNMWI
jgi:hypothetical protein